MNNILDYHCLFSLLLSLGCGSHRVSAPRSGVKGRKLEEDMREDFGVIQGAKLTLLGLII